MTLLFPEELNRSTYTVACLILIVLSLVSAGCSNGRPPDRVAQEASSAPVVSIQLTSQPDVLEAVGNIRAVRTSQLAAQMMGTIAEVRVREGDHVQRGQTLALLDDAQPRAALERATAAEVAAQQEAAAADSDLALAAATLQRYQVLRDRKSVSPQEFDEIQARCKAAQARRELARAGQAQSKAALQQARTALAYTRIGAPFDGLITEKKAEVGGLAMPGMGLFTLEDLKGYRLEVTVNEGDLRHVRQGQKVSMVIDALGDSEREGKVVEIVPAADPASRSFLVKVELPLDPALHSGLFGRARFARGERLALLIPRSAVVERGQLQGVYVLDQNHVAWLRYITLGPSSANQVEVLAGLQTGELLVADPGSQEFNGRKIASR
jgi:RND family efflux transporter MFP subunit